MHQTMSVYFPRIALMVLVLSATSGCLYTDKDGADGIKQDVEDYYVHQVRNLEYLNEDVRIYVRLQERLTKELISDVNDYYAYHNAQIDVLRDDVKAYEQLQLRLAVALKQDLQNYMDYQRSLTDVVRADVQKYWANESIKRTTASKQDITDYWAYQDKQLVDLKADVDRFIKDQVDRSKKVHQLFYDYMDHQNRNLELTNQNARLYIKNEK